MVTVIARWKIKQPHVAMVRQILNQMMTATRNEPGNLRYDLYQTPQDESEILLYEQYADDAAVDAHRASKHFIDLVVNQILPLLETREVDVFKK